MSLLRREAERWAARRHELRAASFPSVTSLEDLVRIRGAARASLTSAGTIDGALQVATVWRSVNKIAGMVAQMPWQAMRGRDVVEPGPALLRDPSVLMPLPAVWKRSAVTSMLLSGGVSAFADDPVRPTKLELIHPDLVSWTPDRGWAVEGEEHDEWPVGPLWHVPLMTLPGSPKGVNPIEYMRRTTYAALAAKEFGGNFFRDGAHPTTVIAPKVDPGKEAAEELKQRIRNVVSGTSRDPLVLPADVEFRQIQVSPEDSQFLDLMRFSGAEIAGFFGLMPEHVGLPVDGTALQYSNRENRQQDLLQDAVMPVLIPLQEGLSALLPRPQRVRFNPAGLLRADLKARYDSYKVAAEIGNIAGEPFLTVDEMRDLEDREPLPKQAQPPPQEQPPEPGDDDE